jgi:hypothetical protein
MYRHTQIAGWMFVMLIGTGVFVAWVLMAADAPAAAAWSSLAIILACAVLFGSLTVEIDHDALRFWFGPGVLRKRIPLSEIAACRTVRNKWWYGWGIRRIPSGWLYNVSGLGAVELTLMSGTKLRVGTDEPEVLSRRIAMVLATR